MTSDTARPTYIAHVGTAFEDAETVDEVDHEITAQGVVL